MTLNIKINKVPMTLGQELSSEVLESADFKRTGLLKRLINQQPMDQTVFSGDDCELEGLDSDLHIYPCTHGYLNQDRQWRTKATLYLKNDRLLRILFQVVDGQTAALNFVQRFETAAGKAIGQPYAQDQHSTRWRAHDTHLETLLYPDRFNADFIIENNEKTED